MTEGERLSGEAGGVLPHVSVVLPAYNNATTLAEAVASVRSQGWPGVEIIVVDDGSTDETPTVLAGLAGPDLRAIRQPNAGPAAARNAGIAVARGEWVAFLDADDVWLPGKLAAQFSTLGSRPGSAFCFTNSLIRYTGGAEAVKVSPVTDAPLLMDMLWGTLFATSTLLVRLKCLSDVGVFDTGLRTGEDWDLALRLASCYEGVLVPRALIHAHKSAPLRSADLEKYPVKLLERCTRQVLSNFFSDARNLARNPWLTPIRRRVYAWHFAVLAKSCAHNGHPLRAASLALTSLLSHPVGVVYLFNLGSPRSGWQ